MCNSELPAAIKWRMINNYCSESNADIHKFYTRSSLIHSYPTDSSIMFTTCGDVNLFCIPGTSTDPDAQLSYYFHFASSFSCSADYVINECLRAHLHFMFMWHCHPLPRWRRRAAIWLGYRKQDCWLSTTKELLHSHQTFPSHREGSGDETTHI